MQLGGLTTGVAYNKLYTPEFLGPFGFRTGYDFGTGYSKTSGQVSGQPEGGGLYYTNAVNLGLTSINWKDESALFDYTYFSRRDHGPLTNNSVQQTFRLTASTRRVPSTHLSANVNYIVREGSTGGYIYWTSVDSTFQNRTINYDIQATHATTSYLSLIAGAQRGNSVTTTTSSALNPAFRTD